MVKKLVQYGGYLLSIVLIAWLINPALAINSLQILLKTGIIIIIPLSGIRLLNRIISLKSNRIWNYSVFTWLIGSLYISFLLVKTIEKTFSLSLIKAQLIYLLIGSKCKFFFNLATQGERACLDFKYW